MNKLPEQNNGINNPQSDDESFQDLTYLQNSKNTISTQTEITSNIELSPSKSMEVKCQNCNCGLKSSATKSKQESQDSNGVTIARLHYQIRRLRMEVGILKLENDVLTKKNNLNKDQYYEGVINGMQLKINQLAGFGDESDSD